MLLSLRDITGTKVLSVSVQVNLEAFLRYEITFSVNDRDL